jgi:hypothetical protein
MSKGIRGSKGRRRRKGNRGSKGSGGIGFVLAAGIAGFTSAQSEKLILRSKSRALQDVGIALDGIERGGGVITEGGDQHVVGVFVVAALDEILN